MNLKEFPKEIQPFLLPRHQGHLKYRCLGCDKQFGIDQLLYTCPECFQVLLIEDLNFDALKDIAASQWYRIFNYRKMLNIPALKGIYRFHEFIGPILPLEAVVYLGEGHTPCIEANPDLQNKVGARFFFKNDGQNPSASFKDRGMASAFSYINYLIHTKKLSDVLAVCASTGDTSASAALYAAYLRPAVKCAVLLPHGKVTPQQLSQPLGSGAAVFEIPGVFDDCMKVVEALSENYPVALLNSKNAWRILGQESYSYEISQEFEYEVSDKVIVVPIGNAGNITAIISGFLKFFNAGIIQSLPKILGVQSTHANPVYRYYIEPDPLKREFKPVTVRPSVAQAAMIGNPVSMPRVVDMVERFNSAAGCQRVFVVEVSEQEIMDWELLANRNGHIACTQGGESLAGLAVALKLGIVDSKEIAIVDSTAHTIKFSGFQDMYFKESFPADFEISSDSNLINVPMYVHPEGLDAIPAEGKPLKGESFHRFVTRTADEIARVLGLEKNK